MPHTTCCGDHRPTAFARRAVLAAATVLSALLAACASAPPAPTAAAGSDWPTYGLDLANQRFSPLAQIDRTNVGGLVKAWQYNSGVKATFQATPIVVGGTMYLSLPFNDVVALDAVTGKERWRYQHVRRKDYKLCCGPANRGVAVSGGKVFIGTVDARLVSLDAATGKVLWDMPIAEDQASPTEQADLLKGTDLNTRANVQTGGTGVGISMAPVVYQGKVIIGITGVGYGLHLDAPREGAPLGAVVGVSGNYGRSGFLAAFDAATGQRQWQFNTIAPANWEGQFRTTTPDGDFLNRDIDREKATLAQYPDAAWFGGGSAWSTPAIDPELGLLYFGTGNPSPQMDDVSRPGDNLYSVSLVALDVATGQIRWHYQQVPHDRWGYDVASPPILFDYVKGDKTVKAVGQASKIGYFFVHDRATGALLLKSDSFVPRSNTYARATKEGVLITPGVTGGVNWSPAAIDGQTQRAYLAAIDWPVLYKVDEIPAKDGKPAVRFSSLEPVENPRAGNVSAIDLATGKLAWQHATPEPMIGGVLATAGKLVFAGEGNGRFSALDADTGQTLWSTTAEAGVNAPAITYAVGGRQYVAVAAGGNQLFGYKQGDALLVFALPVKR